MSIKGIVIMVLGAFFTFIGKSGVDDVRMFGGNGLPDLALMFLGIILLIVGFVLIIKKLKKQ